MFITEEYLEANKTDRGAWTRSQLTAIGVHWPPVAGWKGRAIGRWITTEADKTFREKRSASKDKKYKTDKSLIQAVEMRMSTMSDDDLDKLKIIISTEIHVREYEISA